MNDEYTRDPPEEVRQRRQAAAWRRENPPKSRTENVSGGHTLRNTGNADRLKGGTAAEESYRRKLRHGKADTGINPAEEKETSRQKRRGRKLIQAERGAVAAAMKAARSWQESGKAENEKTSERMSADTLKAAEETSRVMEKTREDGYGRKLHRSGRSADFAGSGAGTAENATEHEAEETVSNIISRFHQKKNTRKEATPGLPKEPGKEKDGPISRLLGGFSEKYEELAEYIKERISEFISEHMDVAVTIAVLILLLASVACTTSACSIVAGGIQNISISTSYTAEEMTIVYVDRDYSAKEDELQEKIDRVETDHPGYDEYRYDVDEIIHNPYELAALLTVLYEDYTRYEVRPMLQTILDLQYELTLTERVERRTRTVTDPETGETSTESYDHRILTVKLINNTVDYVARHMGLTDDQLARYELLLVTYGNKEYLFEDSIYTRETEDDGYEGGMSGEEFGNMLREAESHLGTPYIWNGSSPGGFDCSGFVCWVINHCGNGWNVGRITANGLLSRCTRISSEEARPGDLIFFEKTYQIMGASHVGIYVGNGRMIHCGNPVQYTDINKPYWRNHFLTFGRLNI